MRKKKHKSHEDGHIDESWLIPYADLLTLLLALFIVLFASSSVDASKFRAMAESFSVIFNSGSSVLNYPAPTPEKQETTEITEKPGEDKKAGTGEPEQSLVDIKTKVDDYITTNQLKNQLKTNLTSEGLLITITNDVLFDLGSANVRASQVSVARKIAEALVTKPPHSVVVSGHTDNIPIDTVEFPSNWDLSVMRAVNFMSILLENNNLSPQNFSAKGYGEYRPIAPNDTKENRAKNRRVEVLVVPREGAPQPPN